MGLIALLLALLSGASGAARWLGHRLDSRDPHLDTGDCEQPCWNEIKPGASDRYEVERRAFRWITDRSEFFNSPYFASAEGTGDYLEVFQLTTLGTSLRLADALLFFGMPDTVRCVCKCPSPLEIVFLLHFSQTQVEVELKVSTPLDRLTPDSEIAFVRYFAPDAAPANGLDEPWRGFASLGVYATCARVCDVTPP
jgi:hypothetical protein